jgi:hypothetical protein
MDILQDLIKSLEKEELKSYKLYTKRTHNYNERKDIELFDSIKKHPEESDKYHFNAIYKAHKPDTKYYRLKNKIADDVGIILSNLNHKKTEIDVLHLVGLAKIFIAKQQYGLALHYLKLAERRAIEKEDYAMLEAIYEQLVRMSIQNNIESPKAIIEKRNENSQRLKLLQDLGFDIRFTLFDSFVINKQNADVATVSNLSSATIGGTSVIFAPTYVDGVKIDNTKVVLVKR